MAELNEVTLVAGKVVDPAANGTVPTLAPVRDAVETAGTNTVTAIAAVETAIETASTAGVAATGAVETAVEAAQAAIVAALAPAATPAGENHIGEIGGNTLVVSVTPAVTASPDYSINDALGPLMSIASAARVAGGSGVVNMVSLSSKVALTGPVRVLFFDANPSASTITDNTAVTIDAADIGKFLGHVDLLAANKFTLDSKDFITERNVNIPFKLASGQTLYALAIARAAENLNSTSDLVFKFGLLRD